MKQHTKNKEWDKHISALMKTLFSRGGVRTNTAAEVGFKAVDYFRGADFCDWLIKKQNMIMDKHGGVITGGVSTVKQCEEVGDMLLKNGFIYRADYKPIDGVYSESDYKSKKTPKWPKRLQISQTQKFDHQGFYVFIYEPNKTWQYTLLTLIIVIVLVLCMFPVWPLAVKIAVWYMSVILMTFLIAIVIVRLVFFVLLWFVGYDFWIFPNLFNDDVAFLQAYVPIYQIDKRKDDWLMVVVRITCLLLAIVSIQQLGQTHSVNDVGRFAKNSFFEVIEWGQLKLGANVTNSANWPNMPHRQELPNDYNINISKGEENSSIKFDDEVTFNCLSDCGYQSKDYITQTCISDCDCIKEVLNSSCFTECNKTEQKFFNEAFDDICTYE